MWLKVELKDKDRCGGCPLLYGVADMRGNFTGASQCLHTCKDLGTDDDDAIHGPKRAKRCPLKLHKK